jgi:hypothetical protein
MINLDQFITLCNLEGVYFFTSIEERKNCWYIVLGNSPKIGNTLDRLEPYYNKIVKNVDFSCDNGNIIILVEVE